MNFIFAYTIMGILQTIPVLIFISFMHEVGHAEKLYKYLKPFALEQEVNIVFNTNGFRVGKQRHYDLLTNKQKLNVLSFGIIQGCFFLILSQFVFNTIAVFIATVLYLFACTADLKKIRRLLALQKCDNVK